MQRWLSHATSGDFIERRDHRVMRRMNRWRAPRWIRYWMIAATRMGDGWLWYGLGVDAADLMAGRSGSLRWELRALPGIVGVFVFKIAEETEPAAAALPVGAALLVEGVAAG